VADEKWILGAQQKRYGSDAVFKSRDNGDLGCREDNDSGRKSDMSLGGDMFRERCHQVTSSLCKHHSVYFHKRSWCSPLPPAQCVPAEYVEHHRPKHRYWLYDFIFWRQHTQRNENGPGEGKSVSCGFEKGEIKK
jgi:hypothetical protein